MWCCVSSNLSNMQLRFLFCFVFWHVRMSCLCKLTIRNINHNSCSSCWAFEISSIWHFNIYIYIYMCVMFDLLGVFICCDFLCCALVAWFLLCFYLLCFVWSCVRVCVCVCVYCLWCWGFLGRGGRGKLAVGFNGVFGETFSDIFNGGPACEPACKFWANLWANVWANVWAGVRAYRGQIQGSGIAQSWKICGGGRGGGRRGTVWAHVWPSGPSLLSALRE